jgi:hypothetical protein
LHAITLAASLSRGIHDRFSHHSGKPAPPAPLDPGRPLRASDTILPTLLAEEARLEHSRKNGDLTYPVVRHIEVLVALMAEVNLLPRKVAL